MKGAITVVGLVPGGFTVEDIRTHVPYKTPVQIAANLVDRSRDLTDALQQQRVMQLGNAAVAVPPLAPGLRGRGIAPHHIARPATPASPPPALSEKDVLERELEASRAQCQTLQGVNEALQSTLTSMATQLAQIQQALNVLSTREPVVAAGPSATAQSALPNAAPSFLDEAVPHFIPPTSGEAAEVRISIPENTSTSNVDEARAALRSLRGSKPPA